MTEPRISIRADLESEIRTNKQRLQFYADGKLDEFRKFVSRRSEVLKLLGAGNAAGALALAAFLTTGAEKRDATIAVGAIVFAKLCFSIFGAGTALFGRAYWLLYQFENGYDALLSNSQGKQLDWSNPALQKELNYVSECSRTVGLVTACSLICLVCGSALSYFGVLWFGR